MMLRKILHCACAINGTNPEKGKGKETQNKKNSTYTHPRIIVFTPMVPHAWKPIHL